MTCFQQPNALVRRMWPLAGRRPVHGGGRNGKWHAKVYGYTRSSSPSPMSSPLLRTGDGPAWAAACVSA